MSKDEVNALAEELRSGKRRALARAITLVESAREDHAEKAQALLERLLSLTGKAHRLGITGTPGVGKSTLIEALGLLLVEEGHRVAVLAVDPSSPKSGGSLLGDKTRMQRLSQSEAAFIRPSPSGGQLGGVARKTREAMLLCEAAGFDVIIVETVGVGQSEAQVHSMVDTFALLLHPGGGDELQGVKRGVLELCDLVCVNKADGALKDAARRTRLEYERGMRLLRPGEQVPVLAASALTGEGLEAFWRAVTEHRRALEESGTLAERRAAQAEAWLWAVVEAELLRRFRDHPDVAEALRSLLPGVRAGQVPPTRAALELLARFRGCPELAS